jgi:asparagine synthase (glutamine-hydrolysing)
MCGIAGIVPRRPGDPERLGRLVRTMAEALRHRGPDDDGFFVTPDVALGMRRLSIIDVAGSKQPIRSADGRRTLVFNGEIYNYRTVRGELERLGSRFLTAGDGEVVLQALQAWGEAGLSRLEGMFAFALWDEEAKALTLARDWMGQKSICWAETEEGFAFASEPKALLAAGLVRPVPDLRTLSHFLTLRYLPGEGTLLQGVAKLPPAHLARIGATERAFRAWWHPAYEPKWTGSEREMLDGLDALLQEVVAEHLMSEVPLGAFLSGGIDSSLVVAYAARASEQALAQPLRTFSIGVNEASQSELPWARKVAERYRTRHTEKVVAPDLARLAPRMVAAMEEPVDPFAAGVYLVSEITAEQVTVALGGDGGDELFAGYDRYVGQQLAELYARIPAPLRRRVLRPLLRAIPESFGYKSLATKLRWLDSMAEKTGVERYADSAAFLRFPHALKEELLTERTWRAVGREESERLLEPLFTDGAATAFLDKMLHADCATRLAEHQLPIVDRMAMAHGLEARNPFLDHRVAAYAMRLPAGLHLKHRKVKYVTRTMGERYLPHDLLWREKQGFGFPLALWFRGEWAGMIRACVADSRLVEAGIFRREAMDRLVEEHLRGRIDHNFRLWLLFQTELWYRHVIEGASVPRLEETVDAWRAARPLVRA